MPHLVPDSFQMILVVWVVVGFFFLQRSLALYFGSVYIGHHTIQSIFGCKTIIQLDTFLGNLLFWCPLVSQMKGTYLSLGKVGFKLISIICTKYF